jgi:hypothetical protein
MARSFDSGGNRRFWITLLKLSEACNRSAAHFVKSRLGAKILGRMFPTVMGSQPRQNHTKTRTYLWNTS